MAHTVAHDTDANAHRRGYLPGTDYSLPHLSPFSRAHPDDAHRLRHASCGYLSTPGVPPTLLALKQHAQSLCWLLSMLEPHPPESVAVDGRSRVDSPLHAAGHPPVDAAAATANPFDWFADLDTPYTNDDPDHHRPLFDLINEVQARHELLGTTFHCPLETQRARGAAPYQFAGDGDDDGDEDGNDEVEQYYLRHPYASHHNLLMHANLCLERLDHDYSRTGGLLSILPTALARPTADDDNPVIAQARLKEEEAARNSLVGQWLMFTQHLVGRMHELEIAYSNALTALSGEAEVPVALARRDATAGPPPPPPLPAHVNVNAAANANANANAAGGINALVPPSLTSLSLATQDRWILTNAGDDVWTFLHAMLDQEGHDEDTQTAAWRHQGVLGTRTVNSDRLVYVDVNTRYYRVDQAIAAPAPGVAGAAGAAGGNAANVRGPLFVCPAWERHPGVQVAAEIERRPTVVLVPYSATPAAPAAPPVPGAAPAGAAPVPGPAPPADPPADPVRAATALEHRYDERLREAGQAALDNVRLAKQLRLLRNTHLRLQARAEKLQEANDGLQDALAAVQQANEHHGEGPDPGPDGGGGN